jgi:hypothetical protein
MHGGCSTGAPRGNENALKHGRYTLKAKNERKKIAEFLREIRLMIASAE